MYKFFVSFNVNDRFGNCVIERNSNISSYDDITDVADNISQMLNESDVIIINYRRLYDD